MAASLFVRRADGRDMAMALRVLRHLTQSPRRVTQERRRGCWPNISGRLATALSAPGSGCDPSMPGSRPSGRQDRQKGTRAQVISILPSRAFPRLPIPQKPLFP